MTAVIDNKGRVTIPKKIRDELNLQPGEEIEFVIVNNKLLIEKKLNTEEFLNLTDKLAKEYADQSAKAIDVEKLF